MSSDSIELVKLKSGIKPVHGERYVFKVVLITSKVTKKLSNIDGTKRVLTRPLAEPQRKESGRGRRSNTSLPAAAVFFSPGIQNNIMLQLLCFVLLCVRFQLRSNTDV